MRRNTALALRFLGVTYAQVRAFSKAAAALSCLHLRRLEWRRFKETTEILRNTALALRLCHLKWARNSSFNGRTPLCGSKI